MFQLSPKDLVLVRKELSGFVDGDLLADAVSLTGFRPTDVILGRGLNSDLNDALSYANVRGKVAELLQNLASENPAAAQSVGTVLLGAQRRGPDPERFALIDKQTLTPSAVRSFRHVLQEQIRPTKQSLPFALYLERASTAAGRICLIEREGRGKGVAMGTGFLVGADRVLTNYHVMSRVKHGRIAGHTVSCRFDFHEESGGKVMKLASAKPLALSPFAPSDTDPEGRDPTAEELDYALLQLAEPVDKPRGWYDLATAAPAPPADEPIIVLGHADGAIQSVAAGRVLVYAAEGRRMHHDAYTKEGSSGSPIFNADFELVALHHATDPDLRRDAQFNQGVPVALIESDIRRQTC